MLISQPGGKGKVRRGSVHKPGGKKGKVRSVNKPGGKDKVRRGSVNKPVGRRTR